MAMEERKVHEDELGRCPHCGSIDYSRSMRDVVDDYVYFDCTCNDCKKLFRETFSLTEQKWNEGE